jgi:ABC-type spermidine/putrescine transport systems, ATPase components
MGHVTFENVGKSFGDHRAIEHLDLSIERGEFLTLLGPSGCGKSTTLRMLAGFLSCDEGRITVGGRDVTNVLPQKRDNGIVFQGYALFPHMTVAENVAFGLEMRKVSKPDIKRRVAEALEMVRLHQYADRLPRQLSGGQQQRVALARAIVIEPSVLLLDEPLSALDAKLRLEVRNDIRAMQRRLGLTTIFVTHDQEEALSLSDRIAVMNGGLIQQVGTPEDIYERSRTRFVASFVGKTNFFEGRSEAGRFRLASGETLAYRNAPPGDDYRFLSVRPEVIAVSGSEDIAQGENRIACAVRDIEYLGATKVVTAVTGSGEVLTANYSGGMPQLPQPGERVILSWSVEQTLPLTE